MVCMRSANSSVCKYVCVCMWVVHSPEKFSKTVDLNSILNRIVHTGEERKW